MTWITEAYRPIRHAKDTILRADLKPSCFFNFVNQTGETLYVSCCKSYKCERLMHFRSSLTSDSLWGCRSLSQTGKWVWCAGGCQLSSCFSTGWLHSQLMREWQLYSSSITLPQKHSQVLAFSSLFFLIIFTFILLLFFVLKLRTMETHKATSSAFPIHTSG